MTDATDGRQPAPPLPSGWYDDPSGRFDLRYHNGFAWTGDVTHDGRRFVDPQHPSSRDEPAGPAAGQGVDGSGPLRRESLATASMVLGILSICLAWLPLLFAVGIVLAVLAIVFGVTARRRSRRDGTDADRAVVGLITGGIGVGCSIVGGILTVVLFQAVDRWDHPAPHEVTLSSCEATDARTGSTWAARGDLVNLDDEAADFTVRVLVSPQGSGRSAASETVELDDVAPGESRPLEVVGGRLIDFEPECSVEVNGPKPFGVDLGG